jgi:hypothetical protein
VYNPVVEHRIEGQAMTTNVSLLLNLHNAGGVLEEPATNIKSLESYTDGNPDTTELIEAAKAAILARRHLEETIQRLHIKYKV